MVSLVDTHCHLDAHYFPNGPEEVIDRARDAGVDGFIVIGVGADLAPARAAIALARKFPLRIGASVGVHPHDASGVDDARMVELEQLAMDPCVVALGEMGLDYHYDSSPREAQRAAFARQIALARIIRKPIVIHTREAGADTLDILSVEGAREVAGVIHCFSEDRAFATRALDLGFDLSFSGIVTFKSATAIQDVAAWAPLDRILLETDSPYLSPVPLRGKPCEPSYIVHTAERVAALRKMTLNDLALATSQNAERCFRRMFPRSS